MIQKQNRIRKLEQNPNQRGHESPHGKQGGCEDTATASLSTSCCSLPLRHWLPHTPTAHLLPWETGKMLLLSERFAPGIKLTMPMSGDPALATERLTFAALVGRSRLYLLPSLQNQGCPKA